MESSREPMLPVAKFPVWLSALQMREIIGKGGFGLVCRASKLECTNFVDYAVKLAYLPGEAKDEDLRLLQREAKIKPIHRNIVRFYETAHLLFKLSDVDDLFCDFEDDEALESLQTTIATSEKNSIKKKEKWNGIHVFIHKMELCDYSLRHWIDIQIHKDTYGPENKNKLYSDQEDILRGINEGLLYLHVHKVIHRDLKSENILIISEDRTGSIIAKIADFSIGRIYHDDGSWTSQLTEHPTTTKMYMAPELMNEYVTNKGLVKFNSNQTYSLQCDLFSLGFIYVELLQLVPSDKRQSLFTLLRDQSQALSLIKDHPRIPSTKPVIIRLLQNDTNQRLKSVQEVQQMLDELLVSNLRQWEIITMKKNEDLLTRYEGKIKLIGNIKSKIIIPSNTMLIGNTKVCVDEIMLDVGTTKCTIKGIRAKKIVINGKENTLSGIELHRSLQINGDGNIAKDVDFDLSKIPPDEIHECGVEMTGNNNTLIDVGTKHTRYVDTGTGNKISHVASSGGGRHVDPQFLIRKQEFDNIMVKTPQSIPMKDVSENTTPFYSNPPEHGYIEKNKRKIKGRILWLCIICLLSVICLTGVGFALWYLIKPKDDFPATMPTDYTPETTTTFKEQDVSTSIFSIVNTTLDDIQSHITTVVPHENKDDRWKASSSTSVTVKTTTEYMEVFDFIGHGTFKLSSESVRKIWKSLHHDLNRKLSPTQKSDLRAFAVSKSIITDHENLDMTNFNEILSTISSRSSSQIKTILYEIYKYEVNEDIKNSILNKVKEQAVLEDRSIKSNVFDWQLYYDVT